MLVDHISKVNNPSFFFFGDLEELSDLLLR